MMMAPVLSVIQILAVLLLCQAVSVTQALSSPSPNKQNSPVGKRFQYGGGRTAGQADMPNLSNEEDDNDEAIDRWQPQPLQPDEARLTVVQITDVYTLEHFASLKTMLATTRQQLKQYKQQLAASEGEEDTSSEEETNDDDDQYLTDKSDDGVISVLTGDFLAPYLLSSVDRGKGMMRALAGTPVDYLTWGNHEADIDHRTVCRHVREFNGKWINSNMLDHEAMDAQQDYDVVEIESANGHHKRRIGLVGVLSDDPDLYSHFKPPGAFGGATITDPWKTLQEYQTKLEGPTHNCDVVLPLQHLYVPDDHKTCQQFDFPVVLSGHDHHRVDEIVHGTRLLKPGLDAIYATVLELSWATAEQVAPTVKARFVKTDDWPADPELEEINDRAYDSLAPLRDTELARVPPAFEPLSSVNSRGRVCSMGRFLCSLVKSSLNSTQRRQRAHRVDAVLLMGGNIRGGTDYPKGSYFSLEALEAEIKPDESVAVVQMPGWLLAKGVAETHSGDPIPGWIQYDDGVKEKLPEDGDGAPVVTHVNDLPIDPDMTYRVATKISDLANGQSPSWKEYYTTYPEALPTKGAYVNVYAELMSFFSKNLWRKMWEAMTPLAMAVEKGTEVDNLEIDATSLDELCDVEANCLPEQRLSVLDQDDSGVVTIDDIHLALADILHLSVDGSGTETSLAEFVHNFADADGDGVVTVGDMKSFCAEIPEIYDNQKWRLAFPRPEQLLSR
eukprot:Sro116_g056960.2  (727) ;mRNA; f:17313-19643